MYTKKSGIVIGFHGCDERVCNKLINNCQETLNKSEKSYDWLGSGMYFWEENLERAIQWAKKSEYDGKIQNASVLGAVIDLGNCLDFIQAKYLKLLKVSYESLKIIKKASGTQLPINKDSEQNPDLRLRYLDCAVINHIHKLKGDQTFDSVKGVFWEGQRVYATSGFKDKNHIQICVRNPNCIKGFFKPRDLNSDYLNP